MLSRNDKSDKPHSFDMNVKQVKQEPLEVCVTWKVVGFLEFHIFPGYKNINMLLVILFIINTFTCITQFIFSKKVFNRKLLDLVLPYTSNHHSSISFIRWS